LSERGLADSIVAATSGASVSLRRRMTIAVPSGPVHVKAGPDVP
jgi:hypothetical protein